MHPHIEMHITQLTRETHPMLLSFALPSHPVNQLVQKFIKLREKDPPVSSPACAPHTSHEPLALVKSAIV